MSASYFEILLDELLKAQSVYIQLQSAGAICQSHDKLPVSSKEILKARRKVDRIKSELVELRNSY